ncbi:hypothetical protein [Streptomyces thioluteus]|uniref:hypothetical protein n=1 Tax=Streptomyces thioluteus TaxID=66431 RepID=UPI0031EB1285
MASTRNELTTMVRSRMAAISGTRSMSPSTMMGPLSPDHAWWVVEPWWLRVVPVQARGLVFGMS